MRPGIRSVLAVLVASVLIGVVLGPDHAGAQPKPIKIGEIKRGSRWPEHFWPEKPSPPSDRLRRSFQLASNVWARLPLSLLQWSASVSSAGRSSSSTGTIS